MHEKRRKMAHFGAIGRLFEAFWRGMALFRFDRRNEKAAGRLFV
jgi:hypothetical protein